MVHEESVFIDPSEYPLGRKDETVIDNYHGTMVRDPYRWLEDPDSEETKNYVAELNKISEPFLKACSLRSKLSEKITEMWNYERYGCTSKHGDFYYYYHNTGLQNQSVLYRQKELGGKAEVFLDPNVFSDDGTTSVSIQRFSPDGAILAYGLSEAGSDWVTLKFRKVDGEDMTDIVRGVKHSSIAWLSNNSGVIYSKYPDHKSALEGCSTEKHSFQSLYYHKLGSSEEDVLIADFRWDPELMCSAEVSEDGRYLIAGVSKGCDPVNSLYFYDLKKANNQINGKLELTPLFVKNDAKYEFIDNDDNTALVLTNANAPMCKLIRVNMDEESDNKESWETVIAENEKFKLDWVVRVYNDYLVAAYIEDVKTTLYLHDVRTGKRICRLPLPIGSISVYFGKKELSEFFVLFESFFTPGIVYHLDLKEATSSQNVQLKEIHRVFLKDIDVNEFCSKQVFYSSRDGTKIPMYILSRKDVVLNGANPTILNGYGGFNIADLPYFSVSRLLFLKHFNGIYASANLRGGSEYGERWHEAGMRENKQNVFDDFIAAAEYLINGKYTSSKRLAIHGGSNGGLLVAACSQQRPGLFGAVINRVGVLDMLRYHKFTVGGAWIPEYGNPDDASDFPFIYKYSPLHNLPARLEVQWPSTLLMTADHDDRVVPSHSLKYIATIYEAVKHSELIQKNPILIRVEVKAGHGAGKPTSKIIDELVDMYSFLQRVLPLEWRDG
ncbi:unnamed protein product [Enterobius vermicularis]|uniref:Prolyl endopeptidase n=1 Tax=Enterobius vermicularis TaxID=51028 RepID=A0A0N4USI4_ENTVE|nr:unnamed protein product [Enterobius vermicularis]